MVLPLLFFLVGGAVFSLLLSAFLLGEGQRHSKKEADAWATPDPKKEGEMRPNQTTRRTEKAGQSEDKRQEGEGRQHHPKGDRNGNLLSKKED